MNVDALVLALLAVGDLLILVEIRRWRSRRLRVQRMYRSLSFAVRREIAAQ
jgi:hypothetical protein